MFLEVWLSSRILAQHCDRNKTTHNGFHQWSLFSQYGWLMSIILALKMLKWRNRMSSRPVWATCEVQTSLGYKMRSSLKQTSPSQSNN